MERYFCNGKKDFCEDATKCNKCRYKDWKGGFWESDVKNTLAYYLGDDYDLDRLKELIQADRDRRCVVLPCKAGDVLFKIGYTTCKYGETHPDSYGCCGCDDECDMKLCVKDFVVPNVGWILFNYSSLVDGNWYFTKEEAEKALKERENNG